MKVTIAMLFLVALTGCSSLPLFKPGEVSLSGNTVTYTGMIWGSSVLEMVRKVEASEQPITTLRINSPGGEIESGIELGYFVRKHQLNVVVDTLCFSACANYVLTAAESVEVEKGALVAWHGGAMQKDELWKASAKASGTSMKGFDEMIARLRKKETRFFDVVQVDPKITVYGQELANTCQKDATTQGWFYQLGDLEHMGLHSITLQGGAFATESADKAVNACEMPKIF